MGWGWDVAMAHYEPADEPDDDPVAPVDDDSLIATLNQAGNWHCTQAARRIASLKREIAELTKEPST